MMTRERWQRIDEVLKAVLARPEPDRPAAALELTVGDDALRADVQSLLSYVARADAAGFGDAPLVVGAPRPTLVSRQLGPYTVQELIGVGGMGEVYRAHDVTLGRDVALKSLPEPWLAEPERHIRFEREARLLASLNHPNIGAIYGVHDGDGIRTLVLELVEGETLAERIARHTRGNQERQGLPLTDVTMIGGQLLAALEAAHARGIVHRDFKPANIKITPDGRVKVLDFGLARVLFGPDGESAARGTDDPSSTRVGGLLGTAAYMSPEQARGRAVDRRTDVWAFGCVLFEMLTGTQAFGGGDLAETLSNVISANPDWHALPRHTPRALRLCLRRCLQRDPDQRLHDIADVRLVMEGAFDSLDADGDHGRVAWFRRHVAVAGAVVAALAAIVALGALVASRARPGADATASAVAPRVMVKPKIGGGGSAMTRTIQEAIDLAVRGATVTVPPGTYAESLTITRGLTLEATGERSGQAVVASSAASETTIEIATTEPVIIRGLALQASGGTAIRAIGEVNLTVERTTVQAVNPPQELRALIQVSNDTRKSGARAKAVIRQNVVDGSVTALPRGVARPQTIGIQFVGDLDAVLEGNTIRRTGAICVVVDTREDFAGDTNVEILNNQIDECHPIGRVSAVKVGSPPVGLLSPRLPVTATGTVNVIGNTIRNSSQDCLNSAIAYDVFGGRIERNRIVDFVQPCAGPNPRNLPAAIWLGLRPAIRTPAVAPVVRYNDVHGNGHAGLRIAPNQTIPADVSCNYWGSPKGPSGIGSGQGDAIVVEPGAPAPRFLPFATAPVAQRLSPACS